MSKRSNAVRGGSRRTAVASVGVLGLLMFATGLSLVVQGGSTAANTTYPSNKVWVCKYVTDPKTVTKLKLGNGGLVDVSITTLTGKGNTFNGTFPAWFNDKHGKSEALGWAGPGFPVPVANYATNTCYYPTVTTPTPTPTPTSSSSSPSSSASATTPTPTQTKPVSHPSSVTPTSNPTSSTSSSTPAASTNVTIPTKVHSGLLSVGPAGSSSPMRAMGLGLASVGSMLMLGAMGLIRRTVKR